MNDVLRPDLVWINGRCYRANDSSSEITPFYEHDLYKNEVNYDGEEGESDDDDLEIISDGSRYSTSLHVPQQYFGYIIGRKGAIKCRIEIDTRTDIKIPKQGQTGDIKIFGSNASNVKAARRRINIIVMSSRMKQKSTHFISVPTNNADIIKNFECFKESVLLNCQSNGLEESLFKRPSKLHLTIGVMCLMDNEERLIASKLLMEAKDTVVMPLLKGCLPMNIRIKGLSYMNDDPSAIDVLYACVQEEDGPAGILQELADSLVDYFCKAGYMKREHDRDNVKLHVTLINSRYRAKSSNDVRNDARKPFDGTEILKRYADYDFGVIKMKEIHLSQRFTMGDDGYYQPTCIISCDA